MSKDKNKFLIFSIFLSCIFSYVWFIKCVFYDIRDFFPFSVPLEKVVPCGSQQDDGAYLDIWGVF